MTDKLLLATRNVHKVGELQRMLEGRVGVTILSTNDFPDVDEPEETAITFLGNAQLKAEWYAARTGLPALADDSGLAVDALEGRPGIHSARYAPTNEERIARVLTELRDTPDDARCARFVCAMAVANPPGIMVGATVACSEGRIGRAPQGSGGFGYDPIFFVPSAGITMAEMSPEAKDAISHRGRALRALAPLLQGLLRQTR